jgi:dCMP deaminase
MTLVNNIKNLIKNINRVNWNEYFMSTALLISSRSSCSRLHVGCILVKNNRIISSGYNGFLPKAPHESIVINNHEQATIHAEQNAITDCAKRGVSTDNCIAYITHYPCINCTKSLIACGVIKIYYLDDYKNDPLVIQILDKVNIPIIQFS